MGSSCLSGWEPKQVFTCAACLRPAGREGGREGQGLLLPPAPAPAPALASGLWPWVGKPLSLPSLWKPVLATGQVTYLVV